MLQSHNDYNLGTLCIIDSKPRKLSTTEKETLFDFGMITQNALQSLRHEDKDIHTELYNRRGFLSIAEFILENSCEQKVDATLIYFDMLNFSSLVEQYGNLIEKEILGHFVKLLKSIFRESDLLARIDEGRFVALTIHQKSFKIESLLNRFKEKVKTHNSHTNESFQIKFRAGTITSSPEYLKVSGRLLDLVDKRMFEDKFTEFCSLIF